MQDEDSESTEIAMIQAQRAGAGAAERAPSAAQGMDAQAEESSGGAQASGDRGGCPDSRSSIDNGADGASERRLGGRQTVGRSKER